MLRPLLNNSVEKRFRSSAMSSHWPVEPTQTRQTVFQVSAISMIALLLSRRPISGEPLLSIHRLRLSGGIYYVLIRARDPYSKTKANAISLLAASLCWRSRLRQGRCEFRLLPDLSTIPIEYDRYGYQDGGDTAEKGASPVDMECFEHVHAEQWEDRPGKGSQESVCSNCRCSAMRS